MPSRLVVSWIIAIISGACVMFGATTGIMIFLTALNAFMLGLNIGLDFEIKWD